MKPEITIQELANQEYERLMTHARQHGDCAALRLAADDIVKLRRELDGHIAFRRSVDEALNMGDGSYRP